MSTTTLIGSPEPDEEFSISDALAASAQAATVSSSLAEGLSGEITAPARLASAMMTRFIQSASAVS